MSMIIAYEGKTSGKINAGKTGIIPMPMPRG